MLFCFENGGIVTESLERIRNYIDILENTLGLDIIIYDECRFLTRTALSGLPQLGKWHTNPYCLKIKENDKLRRRCVHLKQAFVNKILSGEGVTKSTCFCGVTEYALPIIYGEHLVCMVAATGFRGELRNKMCDHLCRRTGLTYAQLTALREQALPNAALEEHVICSIEILSHLLGRYIMEETEIPALFDKVKRESNDHVLRAMNYIAQNFTEPINAEMVAKHCHVTTSYLQHLFSGIIGHGIAEEIRLCRLDFAKELLCTTEHSVKYIAFLSGFSSADYFSTVFRKHFGAAPLQYRKIKDYRSGFAVGTNFGII